MSEEQKEPEMDSKLQELKKKLEIEYQVPMIIHKLDSQICN